MSVIPDSIRAVADARSRLVNTMKRYDAAPKSTGYEAVGHAALDFVDAVDRMVEALVDYLDPEEV